MKSGPRPVTESSEAERAEPSFARGPGRIARLVSGMRDDGPRPAAKDDGDALRAGERLVVESDPNLPSAIHAGGPLKKLGFALLCLLAAYGVFALVRPFLPV